MNVAPLFSLLYIVGYYLLLYGRTNNVVKRRAALCFAACQSKKVLPAWFASVDADIRIGRRRHPYRSTQTSASVGADIRIGRRRHPHRSAQTSASVGAAIRIGRRSHPHRSAQTSASVDADAIGGYGIPAIPTQPPPRHPHATTARHPHAADCVGGVSKLPYSKKITKP